jgi:hypothetical protein
VYVPKLNEKQSSAEYRVYYISYPKLDIGVPRISLVSDNILQPFITLSEGNPESDIEVRVTRVLVSLSLVGIASVLCCALTFFIGNILKPELPIRFFIGSYIRAIIVFVSSVSFSWWSIWRIPLLLSRSIASFRFSLSIGISFVRLFKYKQSSNIEYINQR